MNGYRRIIVLSVVILSFSLGASSQQSRLVNPDKVRKLDSFFNTMATNGLFNGSVTVVQNGHKIYSRSAGYYSFEKKIKNSETTVFNLASGSKPFTSLAVLQLYQAQKLSLDDAVLKYLPDFPFRTVTIRQLLTHTSGLPKIEDIEDDYIKAHPDEVISNDKAYHDLIGFKDSLMFMPGDRFRYTNTNYFILARLVEKISGKAFDAYIKEKIFDPAGMKCSYVRKNDQHNMPRYILPTMYSATYVNVDSLDRNKFFTYYQLGSLPGCSNIMSTMEDLQLFDKAFTSGKLVKLDVLTEAFKPAVLNNGKKVNMGGVRTYGLGWNIMEDTVRGRVFFHDGSIPGLTTMILKDPVRKLTIFYYDNTASKGFGPKIGTITRILNDEPLNPIPLKHSAVRGFAQVLVTKGVEAAKNRLDELRADSLHYYFDELEMNDLGYDLLTRNNIPGYQLLSLEVFKMNTEFFPTHPNTYDSYAEALLKNGKKEEAVLMYKKVIELDPKNEDAKKALARISQ